MGIKANDLRLVLNAQEKIEKQFPSSSTAHCHALRQRFKELAELASTETLGELSQAFDSLRNNCLYIKLGWEVKAVE